MKKLSQENIKKLLLLFIKIISFPIWFPWKILFFRKEGKKYNQVDLKTRIFRIIRFPITKPLKLMLYIFVLVFEIGVIYKIRYSIVTYPITKYQVKQYYVTDASSKKSIGIKVVMAKGIDTYSNEIEKSLNFIDDWSLNEKNKMYAILNSKLMKVFFENADEKVVYHLLDKFNNEENYRNGIRKIVNNSNQLIPSFAKELYYALDGDLENIGGIELIVGNVSSFTLYAVDFNFVLDSLGIYASYDGAHDFSMFKTDTIDAIYEIGLNYNNGKNLQQSVDAACSKYSCGW